MKSEIGTCKDACFVFNTQTSFAIYLDFKLSNSSVSFYISDFRKACDIMYILNTNKTGWSKETLDEKDLKNLIGKKASILTNGWGSICYFEHWVSDL